MDSLECISSGYREGARVTSSPDNVAPVDVAVEAVTGVADADFSASLVYVLLLLYRDYFMLLKQQLLVRLVSLLCC